EEIVEWCRYGVVGGDDDVVRLWCRGGVAVGRMAAMMLVVEMWQKWLWWCGVASMEKEKGGEGIGCGDSRGGVGGWWRPKVGQREAKWWWFTSAMTGGGGDDVDGGVGGVVMMLLWRQWAGDDLAWGWCLVVVVGVGCGDGSRGGDGAGCGDGSRGGDVRWQ
ncbi:hypothetical protein Tco_0823743, partial [Tanacetum coccineum]